MKISEIGITYNTPTHLYFWNCLVEPVNIFLVKSPPIWNFTTLPDAASLLHYVTHALRVACYARSFSIVLWTLFQPWTLYRPWTPWRTHFGSSPYDAHTTCGKLCSLFFYCTVNSFPTVNSLPTVNSVTHALWLCPMGCMHYVWQALLALFLLYRELFSDRELFTDRELREACTQETYMYQNTCIVLHTYI